MKVYIFLILTFFTSNIFTQSIFVPSDDEGVPAEVEQMYKKGLSFLSKTQQANGCWQDNYGQNAGVVGLCMVAMLAHGDDPNFGTYAKNIKKCLNFILNAQNKSNGYIGNSMYNHGFATLALAEAYGAVHDERIGPALSKAVDLILTSQANNQRSAWRYSPSSQDADTTVSGAVMVALLAAANAGIEVPEKAINKALKFYESCQSNDGGFGYTSPGGPNMPRTAIGTLVFALAGKKKTNTYKKALSYISSGNTSTVRETYFFYYLYYGSQAFFHAPGNTKWKQWNQVNIKLLKALQLKDGSWSGQYGNCFSTASALLSLALNYRFLPIYER